MENLHLGMYRRKECGLLKCQDIIMMAISDSIHSIMLTHEQHAQKALSLPTCACMFRYEG